MSNAKAVKKKEGILIGTSLDDTMSEYLEEILSGAGFQILLHEENEHSKPLCGGMGTDKYVIIAR